MNGNLFLKIVQTIFTLAPYVLTTINDVHSDASSETKLQLAQEALAGAARGAAAVLTGNDASIAQAVAGVAGVALQTAQQEQTILSPASPSPQTPPVTVPVAAPQTGVAPKTPIFSVDQVPK